LSQEKARWVGDQGQVTLPKNVRKPAPIMTFPTKNKLKPKNVFKISTKRLPESVGGFNSSLVQSAGELWCRKVMVSQSLRTS